MDNTNYEWSFDDLQTATSSLPKKVYLEKNTRSFVNFEIGKKLELQWPEIKKP